MLTSIAQVFYTIVFPMLLLGGLGYALQRRGGLDQNTLIRLNFSVVVPAIIFYSVLKADLRQAGMAVAYTCVTCLGVGLMTVVAAHASGIPRDRWRALIHSSAFANTGNFSLPLQDLAWRDAGLSSVAMGLQSFVMVTQSVLQFTVGVVLAAGRGRGVREQMRTILSFPPLAAVALSLVLVAIRAAIPAESWTTGERALRPFWDVVEMTRQAFMAIALITMGAQIATVQVGENDRSVGVGVIMRMIGGPIVGWLVLRAMGVHGVASQILLISAAAPTAVNTMLLCMQFRNHPEIPARVVLYTTLISPITTTIVIAIALGRLW